MTNYKITNITNTAGKRDPKFNTTLNIDYVDSMVKKNITVKPGETIFLQINSLPLSVHSLRVKKLISVVEVSNNELKNTLNITKPSVIPPVIEIPEVDENKTESTTRKKSGKKSHEAEVIDTQ